MDISIPDSHRLGDVDGDTHVEVDDLVEIVNHIAGQELLIFEEFDAADATQDSHVNILDATTVINMILGTD